MSDESSEQSKHRLEEIRNRPQYIAERWLDRWIVVRYIAGPDFQTDDPNEVAVAQPEARAAEWHLQAIDSTGILVMSGPEDPGAFISWGAVLSIRGPSQEEMEQEDREVGEQTETPPSIDRQELMDLLANADTPTETAVARAAAVSYLNENNSDGDVRAALDQMLNRTDEG